MVTRQPLGPRRGGREAGSARECGTILFDLREGRFFADSGARSLRKGRSFSELRLPRNEPMLRRASAPRTSDLPPNVSLERIYAHAIAMPAVLNRPTVRR